MTIESFFTTQTILPGQSGAQNAAGGGLVSGELGALNFLELLFGQLSQNPENSADNKNKDSDTGKPMQSDNPLLEKNPKLDIAKLLADNPDVAEEIEAFVETLQLDSDEALQQALVLNQQAFDSVLKPLTDGVITAEEIAVGSPRILQALLIEQDIDQEFSLNQISAVQQKIKSLIENGEGALVTTNFTVEELSVLKALPEDFGIQTESFELSLKDLPDTLAEKITITLITLSAPEAQTQNETVTELSDDPVIQSILAILVSPQATQIAKDTPARETQAQLPRDVLPLLPEEASQQTPLQANQSSSRLTPLVSGSGEDIPVHGERFEDTLHQYRATGKAGIEEAPEHTAKADTAKVAQGNGAGTSPVTDVLPPLPFTTFSTLFGPLNVSQSLYNEYGVNITANTALTSGSLTSLVTQAQSATQPHPALQAVAINVQKAATPGQNRDFTIQLDPPDLGRIHAELNFSKEKTVKAMLTIEKPETYQMFQRDAGSLERTLQNIGLDTDGGINFELAEQGFDFDDGNMRGGGHDNGGTGAGDEAADEEIIESTMTWHVDPESGHMRYNILV